MAKTIKEFTNNPNFRYKISQSVKYTLLTIYEKQLNTRYAPQLKEILAQLNDSGVKKLIIDFTHVEYIDASGFSSILTGNRLWYAKGKDFIATGMIHKPLKDLIKITKLETIMTIISSPAEAVDFILMNDIDERMDKDKKSNQKDRE